MLRRHLVLILLVLSLMISVASQAETLDEAALPNMTYLAVTESNDQVHSIKTHVKDGLMYFEMAGQLYKMDVSGNSTRPLLKKGSGKLLDPFEIHEVGEELLNGQRTMHYQTLSRKTGLLEQESWLALDLPLLLALKTVSYDREGNVISTTQILDIEFDPDFSGLDFSKAIQFTTLEGPREATPLTPEEFKKMVPWYDLSQRPLPSYELTTIDYLATYGSVRFTITYSTDVGQEIQVMVYGDQTKLVETHGPSEFDLLLHVRFGEFTLEPAMRSSRTNVMVGFLGLFDRSEGNTFLRNVILHPTLQ